MALPTRLINTCDRRSVSPRRLCGTFVATSYSRTSFFLRLGAQQVGQVVEDFVEIEILLLQLQAAGIDPGEIEMR